MINILPDFYRYKSAYFDEIRAIIESTPNDQELGEKIRQHLIECDRRGYQRPSYIEFDNIKRAEDRIIRTPHDSFPDGEKRIENGEDGWG